jgi:hypothetical protein
VARPSGIAVNELLRKDRIAREQAMDAQNNRDSGPELILQAVLLLGQRLSVLERTVTGDT